MNPKKKRIEISDLPKELAKSLSDDDQAKIAGGYYQWRLENVRVSSYSVSGATDGYGGPDARGILIGL